MMSRSEARRRHILYVRARRRWRVRVPIIQAVD
jgi:hypothetical protein